MTVDLRWPAAALLLVSVCAAILWLTGDWVLVKIYLYSLVVVAALLLLVVWITPFFIRPRPFTIGKKGQGDEG